MYGGITSKTERFAKIVNVLSRYIFSENALS